MAAATGKRASCLFKKRQQPPKPLSASAWAMLMRLVLVGWLSIESPGDWRQAVGEGLGVDDSWDPVSQEQANRERGRKKKKRAIEGEQGEGRERGRQADRLHNARLAPVLMCFLYRHVFLKFVNCGRGEGI